MPDVVRATLAYQVEEDAVKELGQALAAWMGKVEGSFCRALGMAPREAKPFTGRALAPKHKLRNPGPAYGLHRRG